MSYFLLQSSMLTVTASGAASVQGIAPQPGLRLTGFSITEDAATPAAARVRLRHGTDGTGPEMFDIKLSADQSTRESFAPGIAAQGGIYIERVTGTTRITLFWTVQ